MCPNRLEGNQVTTRGLLSLKDFTPNPLRKVVWVNYPNFSKLHLSKRHFLKRLLIPSPRRAIWNDLTKTEPQTVRAQDCIAVNFTDDDVWEAWGTWVLRRCEVSSNEKLVMVLHKVCNKSVHSSETRWAGTFYKQLSQLVKQRIESCTEDDMCKKLKMFESILKLWQTEVCRNLGS